MVFAVVGSFLSFLLNGIFNLLGSLFRLPFNFSFALVLVVSWMWLLFNAPAIYEDHERMSFILLIYIVSVVFLFVHTTRPNPLLGISAAEFLIVFVLWGAIGAFLFKMLAPFTTPQAILTTNSIALLVTHVLVVAIAEELIFRHGIPSMIPGNAAAAQVVSAFLFGAMHFAAYSGSLPTMVFATLLGLVFGWIVVTFPRRGFPAVCALHATWNAAALGFI